MLKVNRKGKSALQWDKVIDSTNKEAFGSGSMRDSQDGKGRYDLIPTGAMHRLAQHYETGAKKYAERNWEKGQPLHQYYNSAIRHLQALRDADLLEDHAAAALWNIVAIMHHIDAMLLGTLPESLDSFGILNAIKKHEEIETTIAQVNHAFSNPEHIPILIRSGTVHFMASGVKPDYPIDFDPFAPLPEYEVPDGVKVVYDKDRFQEQSSKVRRTVKLDPEELG